MVCKDSSTRHGIYRHRGITRMLTAQCLYYLHVAIVLNFFFEIYMLLLLSHYYLSCINLTVG